MLALIMAGGEGTRLNLGEKPLVTVHGTPMIASVTGAFLAAGCDVVVALAPHSPYTLNWCRAQGITSVITSGKGYVEDLVEAVDELEETGSLFTSVSDLPYLQSTTIQVIQAACRRGGRPACSAWVPLHIMKERRLSHTYCEDINGIPAVPAGVNILLGSTIGETQAETRVLLEAPDLAVHVNTRSDLAVAREISPETFKGSTARVLSTQPSDDNDGVSYQWP